jgi:ATP-dependent Lon protease
MPGKGEIRLTGSLRSVMRESATAAVSFVRSRAEMLSLDAEWFRGIDLHLHVPRAGIAHDAASAGAAMYVAVTSLLLEVPARSDVAVVGEITLRGRVLPVTGIKDKVLAAHRAGIRSIVMPQRNAPDLEEVPAEVRKDLEFHLVSQLDQVLPLVLVDPSQAIQAPPVDRSEARP